MDKPQSTFSTASQIVTDYPIVNHNSVDFYE